MNISPQETERFWKRIKKTDTCWLWQGGKFKSGHGNMWLAGHHQANYAHRIMWFLTYGSLPEAPLCILHNCPEGDNPACVNPEHLWVGTKDDNNKDKANKGRCNSPKGEDNNFSVLTEAQVKEIRAAYATGHISQVELAKQYGITQGGISLIVLRKNWKHV